MTDERMWEREIRADSVAAEIIAIADGPGDLADIIKRIAARKKCAAKLAPWRYGESPSQIINCGVSAVMTTTKE